MKLVTSIIAILFCTFTYSITSAAAPAKPVAPFVNKNETIKKYRGTVSSIDKVTNTIGLKVNGIIENVVLTSEIQLVKNGKGATFDDFVIGQKIKVSKKGKTVQTIFIEPAKAEAKSTIPSATKK